MVFLCPILQKLYALKGLRLGRSVAAWIMWFIFGWFGSMRAAENIGLIVNIAFPLCLLVVYSMHGDRLSNKRMLADNLIGVAICLLGLTASRS